MTCFKDDFEIENIIRFKERFSENSYVISLKVCKVVNKDVLLRSDYIRESIFDHSFNLIII